MGSGDRASAPQRRTGDDGEDRLRISPTCVISAAELTFRFSRSGGPGGQHANTADTRVEVRFDIAGSPSLGPRQRERLLERFGPELRVVAHDERSQARNRALAVERLRAKLADGLEVRPPRKASRPTKAAERARLEAKRRHAEKKQQRRWSPD